MATLNDQFLRLRQAGLIAIGTWYRYHNFVVFSGTKPLTTSG